MTVELAAVLPLLVALILGIVDVGQYVNVAQTASSACREAARTAARHGTANVSDVQNAFTGYLADSFPGVSQATFASSTTIVVKDANGTTVASDLTSLPTGSALTVDISMPFDTVRWMDALPWLSGQNLTMRTTVRRE